MKVKTLPKELEKYIGHFGPIEPALIKLRIVGFDTEDDSKGHPLSFAFHDGKTSFYTTLANEAIDFIYNAEETSCFVAHNLEYDIGNLFKHCDFKYVQEMMYATKLLRVSLFGSKNFFLNSTSFFQGSLFSLGTLVGVPKLAGNPLDPAYNIQDAKIPQVFLSGIQDRLHAEGVNLGVSIGQMSMAIFRRRFVPGKQVTFNPPVAVEKAYYGGRVEVFYKGVVEGPVYVADINSSYPDVMRNLPYPDTSQIEISRMETHAFGIGLFTVHVPKGTFLPVLPFRSESGRLFFPTGEITGWWTYAEVRRAVELGARVVREAPGYGSNAPAAPYRDFIDHFWEQREAVKNLLEKDPDNPRNKFESLFLKLVMNNAYGKAAQHRPTTTMLRVRLTASKLRKLKGATECKIGPFYGYTIPRETAAKTANYLWGVHVTSYARLSLLDKMLAVVRAGSTLLYCDTDSIMFTGEGGKTALPFGTKLGEMSLETYDLGVFRQAKGYLLCDRLPERHFHFSKGRVFLGGTLSMENIPHRFLPKHPGPLPSPYIIKKVACKGVPTQHALPFIRDGMAVAHKPMRLKEALIRMNAKVNAEKSRKFFEDIGINVWKDVEKKMRGIYIKRKGEKGITFPVDVEEIPEMEKSAWADPSSMADLARYPIEPKAAKKEDAFRNVVIPKGWYKRHGFQGAAKYYESQRIHFLSYVELSEIPEGKAWFSGVCESIQEGKYGKYFLLRLSRFLNAPVKKKNFLAAFPLKYLEEVPQEKILGKRLEIILNNKYIPGKDADLSLRVFSCRPSRRARNTQGMEN